MLRMPDDERNRTSGKGLGLAAGRFRAGVVGEFVMPGAEQSKISHRSGALLAVRDLMVSME